MRVQFQVFRALDRRPDPRKTSLIETQQYASEWNGSKETTAAIEKEQRFEFGHVEC